MEALDWRRGDVFNLKRDEIRLWMDENIIWQVGLERGTRLDIEMWWCWWATELCPPNATIVVSVSYVSSPISLPANHCHLSPYLGGGGIDKYSFNRRIDSKTCLCLLPWCCSQFITDWMVKTMEYKQFGDTHTHTNTHTPGLAEVG